MNEALYRFELCRDERQYRVRVVDATLGLTVLALHGTSAGGVLFEALILSPCCPRSLRWLRWWPLRRQILFRLRQRLGRFLSPNRKPTHNA